MQCQIKIQGCKWLCFLKKHVCEYTKNTKKKRVWMTFNEVGCHFEIFHQKHGNVMGETQSCFGPYDSVTLLKCINRF